MPRNIWETDGGVYFGQRLAPQEQSPFRSLLEEKWDITDDLHRYSGDRHLVTFGPNGSGKTRRLLVPNLAMLTNWSTLVVDPKGELAVQTAAHRKAAGNEIITLDPFGVIARQYPGLVERQPYLQSAGLNPLSALDPESDDFPDDAKAIAEALIDISSTDTQPHFAQSAQGLVAGLVMGMRLKYGPFATLGMVRTILGSAPHILSRFITDTLLQDLPEEQEAIRAKLSRFMKIDPENREILSMLSSAITKTDWLDSRPIKQDLSRGELRDFGRMKERPITVYLILPPRYLETHATWLRLMITAVLTPLIRTTGGRVPVLFMLDEFAQLGRLEVIERNMALMRGYGVKLWPIFQDLAQAKDVYERRWESFISNAGVVQAFAPQDKTTREYLSEQSGQRIYWLKTAGSNVSQSTGLNGSDSSGMNEGLQNVQGPNYWPQGLSSLQDGQAILFSKGKCPRSWLPDPTEIPLTRNMLIAAENAAQAVRAA